MQLTSERIIELVITTYTSSYSQQIDEAYSVLINYAFAVYPKSFSQIEDILAKNQYQIDINCKKALINLIKVQGQRILETIQMLNKSQDDVISKHKKLLHAVQHILDNKQIDSSLKPPILDLYMDLFLFFTPENWLRLISKAKYYFNTKIYLLAVSLIQAFLSRRLALKYRFLFCQQALELIIQQSYKLVQNIRDNKMPLDYSVLEIFHKYFEVLTDLFREMTFEKFQGLYDRIFSWDQLLKLFNQIELQIFSNFWKKYFHEIYSIIITSLGRCKLYEKYSNIVNILRAVVLNQFHRFMQGQNSEISTLSMLDSAIQYKLIQFNISSFDIFGKLVYPNYLLVSKYLQNQVDNLPQMINFLNDATFYMESQSIQILRNRILYHLCINNLQLFNSFKSLIYSFFCKQVSSFGNVDVKQVISNANIQEGIDLWSQIDQKINQDEQLQIILLTTALSSKFFISDIQFMKKIEDFANENQDYLLLNGNKKIVFYSLLLYKNYMDDIFNNTYSSFRTKIISFALDHTVQIVKNFSLQILKEKLQQRPIYEQFQSQINLIIKAMTRQYNNQLIPIIIIIFRQFGEYINSEDAITIIKETFSIWKGKQIYQNKKSLHLQLLKMFMKIQSCRDYFMLLIEQLLQIANQNVGMIQRNIQDFLQVMLMGLQTCRKLPQNFQQTLVKYQVIVNNVSIMKTMNAFIMYSNQANFFNWLAVILTRNKLNIYEIILIHNLIYYGNKLLTYESIKTIIQTAFFQRIIKPNQFDYRNGKLSLIFLFLLKYKWKQTNDLLKNEDWSYVVEKGKIILQNMKIFGTFQPIGMKPFIQEIYDLLYKFENVYRWKYDIQMFLINQLDIFKYNLNDDYQFMYANLSFLACTTNLLRAYDFIKNQEEIDRSDSDDSINPHTKIQRLHREQQQIIRHFETPPPLKEADYFSNYRKILTDLKKDEKSKKWVETLFKAAFRDEKMGQLNEVLRMQRNNQGNYRKINRIRRRYQGQIDS